MGEAERAFVVLGQGAVAEAEKPGLVAPVDLVADDGEPEAAERGPDLVGAPGDELCLKQAQSLAASEAGEVRLDRLFPGHMGLER